MTNTEKKELAIKVEYFVKKILSNRKGNEDGKFTVIRVMEDAGYRNPTIEYRALHSAIMDALTDNWFREHNIVPENLERIKGDPIPFVPIPDPEMVRPRLVVSSSKPPRKISRIKRIDPTERLGGRDRQVSNDP